MIDLDAVDRLDDRTPIVVGAAEVVHRDGPDFAPMSATALMVEAALDALDGTPLGPQVGAVLVPHGTWVEADPGRAVAVAVGAPTARSVRSELGVLQQSLLARAATDVIDGVHEVVVVVGGENRWSGVFAGKRGLDVPAAPDDAVRSEPDELLEPSGMVIAEVEIARNLTTAAHQYAIIESAIRASHDRSVGAHQRALGALWERFARIAAAAPAGWDQRALDADAIAFESPTNRLIAAPYPKWLVSQWNVDQAAALVFTTVGVARRHGIDPARWVFPLAMAESNAMIHLTARADLHRWPASRVCGDAALAAAGVGVDEIGPVDLYSCFPAAVEVQAVELGLSTDRDLTLTGGMTFGGGPFNNYVLQGAAAMVRTLRGADRPTVGLTSAVSGLLTKPGVALWSNAAPRAPFVALDLTAEARRVTDTLPIDAELTGEAVVVGATVVPAADGGSTTIAVVESDGRRTVVQSDDAAVAAAFAGADPVGRRVTVPAAGTFTLG